jgi:SAM-dependent methyltransferase
MNNAFSPGRVIRDVVKNALMYVPGVTTARKRIFSCQNDPLAEALQHGQWAAYKAAAERSGVELRGADTIELGSGPILGNAVLFIANGAASYTACDRYDLFRTDDAARKAYRQQIASLPAGQRARCDGMIMPEGAARIFDRRVRTVVAMVEGLDLRLPSASFDLVVSFNMLEHVNDLKRTLNALRGILKPNGVMIHRVDVSNHGPRKTIHPLAHLTVSRSLWLLMGSRRAIPNRVRPSSFLAAAHQVGFRTLLYEATTRLEEAQVEPARERLRPEFAGCSLDDLATLDFLWVACLS